MYYQRERERISWSFRTSTAKSLLTDSNGASSNRETNAPKHKTRICTELDQDYRPYEQLRVDSEILSHQ